MRTDLLLLIGTLFLAALNNPTLRILASSRRSNPSPRLLTHTKTPHQVVDKLKVATQCTPPMNGAVPTSPHTKTCRPYRGGTQTSYQLFRNEHATTQSGPGGPDYLPSTRPCEAVSEEGR